MAYVKHAMMASEECICIALEQMKESVQFLEEIGMKNKSGRIEEAMKLLEFDMWNDHTIENIKEVRSTVRTARRGSNSYFSARVYVTFFNGKGFTFTITTTYGYNRSSYVQHIKELLLEELAIKLPRFDSEIPFPFELEVQAVKYNELHKGEKA